MKAKDFDKTGEITKLDEFGKKFPSQGQGRIRNNIHIGREPDTTLPHKNLPGDGRKPWPPTTKLPFTPDEEPGWDQLPGRHPKDPDDGRKPGWPNPEGGKKPWPPTTKPNPWEDLPTKPEVTPAIPLPGGKKPWPKPEPGWPNPEGGKWPDWWPDEDKWPNDMENPIHLYKNPDPRFKDMETPKYKHAVPDPRFKGMENIKAKKAYGEGAELTKLRELAGLPVTEAMISGDWERLGITNDELEPDDAFGGGAWSVGRGGPKSQFFWFKEQDTGTHFATVTDIGNGTWKIEDGDGRAVGDAGITSWDEVEGIVGKMFLGPRSAHNETPSAEEYR